MIWEELNILNTLDLWFTREIYCSECLISVYFQNLVMGFQWCQFSMKQFQRKLEIVLRLMCVVDFVLAIS